MSSKPGETPRPRGRKQANLSLGETVSFDEWDFCSPNRVGNGHVMQVEAL